MNPSSERRGRCRSETGMFGPAVNFLHDMALLCTLCPMCGG